MATSHARLTGRALSRRAIAVAIAAAATLVCITVPPHGRAAVSSTAKPAYGWPVKPFHRQHPVRAFFGDPRIGGRSHSFHFGVDVSCPDGTPVYSTYLGGSYVDMANDVAVDAAGNAYVTGDTGSVDFPIVNPLQATYAGGWDGWVSALEKPRFVQYQSSDRSFTRFEMEPSGGGTDFALIDRLRPDFAPTGDPSEPLMWHQAGGPGTHWTGVVAGWHSFVDALERHLVGRVHTIPFETLLKQYDALLTERYARVPATR